MEGWFIFNGKNSKEYGIMIASAPQRIRPDRRVEEINVPGRNGVLTQDEGTYDAYTISMECSTRGSDHLDEIVAWLNGAGDLILSTEPDKVYHASIYNKIAISDVIYLYNSFLLQFKVQPFKYGANALSDIYEWNAPETGTVKRVELRLNNRGTIYSEPTFTIYGNGTFYLSVKNDGGYFYAKIMVDEQITIDSEMMEIYKGSKNQNSKYEGTDFPKFQIGENYVLINGLSDAKLKKVEINPKWRWL